MNKVLSLLALFASGSAFAVCPDLEGKYAYACTVEKDVDATFADVLEVAGEISVLQKGCDSYTFTNMRTHVQEELSLVDDDRMGVRNRAKIRKASAQVLKFKTVENRALNMPFDITWLRGYIMTGKIRTTRKGFTLKGRERSNLLGFFGDHHSSFSCRFTQAR